MRGRLACRQTTKSSDVSAPGARRQPQQPRPPRASHALACLNTIRCCIPVAALPGHARLCLVRRLFRCRLAQRPSTAPSRRRPPATRTQEKPPRPPAHARLLVTHPLPLPWPCASPHPRAHVPHLLRSRPRTQPTLFISAMPALLVDTGTRSSSPSSSSSAPSDQRDRRRAESRSPDRPPVSPITPTASVAQLAPLEPAEPRPRVVPPPVATFRPQPPSVPISESENPDAIALRSAISLLQLQREKSKRDLKALEELKAAAVADPQGFVRNLQEQKAQASRAHQDILGPTLADITDTAAKELADGHTQRSAAARSDSAEVEGTPQEPAKFPAIPQPQNIVRCPPVNWAKYHIVGEPLDKMHEEQRRYPGAVEPPRTQQGMKAPPHTIAAPYSPFIDGVGESQSSTPQPWRGPKKSPS